MYSRALYDKRISQEVEGEALGDEFAGYVSGIGVEKHLKFSLPLHRSTY